MRKGQPNQQKKGHDDLHLNVIRATVIKDKRTDIRSGGLPVDHYLAAGLEIVEGEGLVVLAHILPTRDRVHVGSQLELVEGDLYGL